MDISIKVGDTLYLHEWQSGTVMKVMPRKVVYIAKLSEGRYSYEIYFESSHNYSRSITQLGKTMFLTKEEAEAKRKEWYIENHLDY